MGSLERVQLYIKAGVDGERIGACPFCQRIHMILSIKATQNILSLQVFTVNPSKPPPEFKTLGLKHLPAIIHRDEGFDALDDIITYIDSRFPGGGLEYIDQEADFVTKDFFSKFCFYIKSVNQDDVKVTMSLEKLNTYLENTYDKTKSGDNTVAWNRKKQEVQYIYGDHLTHLDCEIVPKLQHLRVGAKEFKNYDIPTKFKGLWRYLHTAYTEPVFRDSWPCDQEIIFHWHDRSEIVKMSHKKHSEKAKEKPIYSLDIPVHASFVTLVD